MAYIYDRSPRPRRTSNYPGDPSIGPDGFPTNSMGQRITPQPISDMAQSEYVSGYGYTPVGAQIAARDYDLIHKSSFDMTGDEWANIREPRMQAVAEARRANFRRQREQSLREREQSFKIDPERLISANDALARVRRVGEDDVAYSNRLKKLGIPQAGIEELVLKNKFIAPPTKADIEARREAKEIHRQNREAERAKRSAERDRRSAEREAGRKGGPGGQQYRPQEGEPFARPGAATSARYAIERNDDISANNALLQFYANNGTISQDQYTDLQQIANHVGPEQLRMIIQGTKKSEPTLGDLMKAFPPTEEDIEDYDKWYYQALRKWYQKQGNGNQSTGLDAAAEEFFRANPNATIEDAKEYLRNGGFRFD